MIDAQQGVKQLQVVKVPIEPYSKHRVYYCFQFKILVSVHLNFPLHSPFSLNRKPQNLFSLFSLLFSVFLSSCFPICFPHCTPIPSRSFEQQLCLIINLTPSLKMLIYGESWHLLSSSSSLYLKELLSQVTCNYKNDKWQSWFWPFKLYRPPLFFTKHLTHVH